MLSEDYFTVPDEQIRHIESVLTVVGGQPVFGAQQFAELAPPPPPAMPDWSPVGVYGGYDNSALVTGVGGSAAFGCMC